MHWLWLVSYFFAGAFAANALPHLISGVTGRRFQTPFAHPPGEGLSSSKVNALWGFFNVVIAYALLARVGTFQWRSIPHIAAFGLGALLLALFSAHHFGKFHGGNPPTQS